MRKGTDEKRHGVSWNIEKQLVLGLCWDGDERDRDKDRQYPTERNS